MAVNRKRLIIIGAVVLGAVVIWWLYRRYQANQSTQSDTNLTTGAGLGTNLNSVAPDLVAGGSTGGSGLTYASPGYDINLTLPNGNSPVDNTSPSSNAPGSPSSPGPVGAPSGLQPAPLPSPSGVTGVPSAPMVTVPNMVGQPLATAQARLTIAGLVYSGPRGVPALTKVKTESPKGGTKVKRGTVVTVGVR